MYRLPVFATVNRAYAFLINDFSTIVRLSWLPLLLATIVQYVAAHAIYDSAVAALEARTPPSGDWPSFWESVSGLIGIVGTAIVAVALHRVILFGDRKPGQFYHIAFGRTEMLFVALPVAVSLFFLLMSASFVTVESGAFLAAFSLLLIFTFFYAMVRLELIFPITVVEGQYNFGRAWALTRGNFWRLLMAWIVAMIPLFAGFFLVMFGAFRGFGSLFDFSETDDASLAMLRRAVEAAEAAASIPMVAVGFCFSLASGAVGAALLCYAYKFLSGTTPDALLPPPPSS